MLKFLSEIKGLKILLFQERAALSVVKDYLIAPDSGELLGVFALHPLDKKIKIIPASHIKALGNDFIIIDSLDSLTEPEEIIKVKEALLTDPKIIGQQVVTESGTKIGKVRDVTLELETHKINKLYVVPYGKIQMLTKELLIPAKKIVAIEKKKIIISDSGTKVKSNVFVPKSKPAFNQ